MSASSLVAAFHEKSGGVAEVLNILRILEVAEYLSSTRVFHLRNFFEGNRSFGEKVIFF